ncbi:hypothetical protein DFQ28_006374 [Apophysomyces sp. BC1034]|nr:hypothetical protein DFQ30_000385 [Apophysomyces sp. BC1015]KAG0176446.1 hypothetical protein DFQ29_006102 [Apophysomyces sp. BC1021]KAG0187428.1 hypothetical protein DFQ28_006374 [Apophysomyces sp. BC1034]
MKFTAAYLLTIFLSIASAQNPIVSITSPLEGTKIAPGQSLIISWINPKVPTISQIVLMRGPPTGLQPVQVVAQNVNAADGSYAWKVPADLPGGQDYALELGTSPDLAYTGQITIDGGAAAPANGATSATGGAAPTGSSTPTGSNTAAATSSSIVAPSSGTNSTGSITATPASTTTQAAMTTSPAAPATTGAASTNSATAAPSGSTGASASAGSGTSDAPRHVAGKLLVAVSIAAMFSVQMF